MLFTLTAGGVLDAEVTDAKDIFLQLPIRPVVRVTTMYQAQLVYVPSTTLTSLEIPMAWIGTGSAPNVPVRISRYVAALAARGLGDAAQIIHDFGAGGGLTLNGASIPVVAADSVGSTVSLTTVNATGLSITLPAEGWYWLTFQLDGAPFLFSKTTDISLTGCGPGEFGAFATQAGETGAFATSPTLATATGAWALAASPSDILLRVNNTTPANLQVSLDGLQWSALESPVVFTAGAWQRTGTRPVNLWDTAIGGTYHRGDKTVTVRLVRDLDNGITGYEESRSIVFTGGQPIVRALRITYRVQN